MNIPYTLVRSKRKTLCVEITRDLEVLVRAPLGLPAGYIQSFLAQNQRLVLRALERERARQAAHPEPDQEELKRLKLAAQALLPERVAHYGAIMGVRPASVKITAARTSFGSCSAKNGLCFSCRLMAYPCEAIDYVVVHELAHIKHKNHGPAFYDAVAVVLPDHKERRRLLK